MARPTAELGRLSTRAIGIAVVGLAASAAGYVTAGDAFWQSYLIGYIFWIGITLGSLAVLMIQHLTGGAWTMVSRRLLEASTRTLPLMALLFVPIWLNLDVIYAWAKPGAATTIRIIHAKAAYLNPQFFALRARDLLRRLGRPRSSCSTSGRGNRTSSRPSCRARPTAAPACCRAPASCSTSRTITFMSVDWVMSLDPHWYSTIFGVLTLGGQGLSTMAFTILMLAILVRFKPMSQVATADRVPRPRQADVRVRHAVGVLLGLAAAHHLVGEPAGGDSVLPRSGCTARGIRSASRCCSASSRCRSCCCCRSSFKRNPERREVDRPPHPRHAHRRHHLDDRAGLPARGIVAELGGLRGGARHRRAVARLFFRNLAGRVARAGAGSVLQGSGRTWRTLRSPTPQPDRRGRRHQLPRHRLVRRRPGDRDADVPGPDLGPAPHHADTAAGRAGAAGAARAGGRGASGRRRAACTPRWWRSASRAARRRTAREANPTIWRCCATREHEILTTYGVADKDAGTYRIPIERAKDLMLERGLPVRGPVASPAPATGKGKRP